MTRPIIRTRRRRRGRRAPGVLSVSGKAGVRYHERMTRQPTRRTTAADRRPTQPFAIESKLFHGLADPTRLGILLALREGPRSAGELSAALDLSPSNASNHLLCLLECGLLAVESNGRSNVYRVADPAVDRLLDAGATLLEAVAPAIEACLNYGPPSRRAMRRSMARTSREVPRTDQAPRVDPARTGQRRGAIPAATD